MVSSGFDLQMVLKKNILAFHLQNIFTLPKFNSGTLNGIRIFPLQDINVCKKETKNE